MSAPQNKKKNNRNSIVPNGQYLKRLRGQLGLTQSELAFRLNLSERLVRKAEKSHRIACGSLVLFQMFFEQQGLAVDHRKLGQAGAVSSKEMAVSFFHACIVQGDLQSIVSRCHEQVSAEVDGQVAVGHTNVKALFETFRTSMLKGMLCEFGPVLNESNTTSIFWSLTRDNQSADKRCRPKNIEGKGVMLVRGSAEVESIEISIFRR